MNSNSLPRLLVAVLALFLLSVQAGSPREFTLGEALASGSEFATGAINARVELSSAERDLSVARADPTTTPMELRAAERAVAAAEDNLSVALTAAAADVLSAYAAVLEAAAARDGSAQQLEILETTLGAVEVRFAAGAATASEVAKAESDVANQRRTLQEAETNLVFARDSLAALIGSEPGALAPITAQELLEAGSADEEVSRALTVNARLRAARFALEAAREQLAATDNALSSRAEIDAARRAVSNADEAVTDLEAALTREVKRAVASVEAARNRYQGAVSSVSAAAADLAAQEARLEAGTISEVAFAQASLALINAEASAASALHALISAQYALRLAVER